MFKIVPLFCACFLMFVLAAVATTDLSRLPDILSILGADIIACGIAIAPVLQLPVTVPLYLMDHHASFAVVQQQALQGRAFWFATLLAWAALGYLASRPMNGFHFVRQES